MGRVPFAPTTNERGHIDTLHVILCRIAQTIATFLEWCARPTRDLQIAGVRLSERGRICTRTGVERVMSHLARYGRAVAIDTNHDGEGRDEATSTSA
jgi:hypothetical protein